MAVVRIMRVEVLEGEEEVLRSKYTICLASGNVCYLDGTRHGSFESTRTS